MTIEDIKDLDIVGQLGALDLFDSLGQCSQIGNSIFNYIVVRINEDKYCLSIHINTVNVLEGDFKTTKCGAGVIEAMLTEWIETTQINNNNTMQYDRLN